ncbi:MAG: hypothetical protein WB800_42195 [Streptosporangiaceae bacterium]
MGDIVGQAVSDAEADMNKVQAAADAISAAIRGVKPWLTPETWEGNAATAWAGEWESFYHAVQSCLNDLPSAESAIVSAVQTQMMQIEAQHR